MLPQEDRCNKFGDSFVVHRASGYQMLPLYALKY